MTKVEIYFFDRRGIVQRYVTMSNRSAPSLIRSILKYGFADCSDFRERTIAPGAILELGEIKDTRKAGGP